MTSRLLAMFLWLGGLLATGVTAQTTQGSGEGSIPNECCPEETVATLYYPYDLGWELPADLVDASTGVTQPTLYGKANYELPMPVVRDGMSGVARYYHSWLMLDMSHAFWTGSGGDLTDAGIPVPPMSASLLDGMRLQPRPGTMPGLYVYEPGDGDPQLFQYGSPVESGASPSSTAIYEPVPSNSSNPVVYTNQLSGAQLWHFGTYLEVRHVDGSIARFEAFNPYTSTVSGKLWRVDWVRDPFDNLADYSYDNSHRLIGIAFPSGLTQQFDYAPTTSGWSSWSGHSLFEVRYTQTSGGVTTQLTDRTWGLVFGGPGPSGGTHFGSRLVRSYSPPRRVLKDPTGGNPHTVNGSAWVTGQIVHDIAYDPAIRVVSETQSVHVGQTFHATLQHGAGLSSMPVAVTEYETTAPHRVAKQTNAITSAAWTLTYGSGSRTSDLLPGVTSLSAVKVEDEKGGMRRYEFDKAKGHLYSVIVTPPDDAHGRPRAHDGTNAGIGGAVADVEPENIEIYYIFDSTCVCQKPIERRIHSVLNGTTSTRTTRFEYFADSRLLKKRIEPNPATTPLPQPATRTWEYSYVRTMTGSQVWGAWLPLQETTPDGVWDYVYSDWLDRADASQHGRMAGTVNRKMANVRLSVALDGTSTTTTMIEEFVHRNLPNNPGGMSYQGNVNGMPRKLVDGDGVSTTFEYRAEGWLEHVYAQHGTVKTSYGYDAAGNVTAITENASAGTPFKATTTFPAQSSFGMVYEAQSTSGGLLRASEYYFDRFGHLAVARQNNLDSNGNKPSKHGGSGANARDWVETQFLFDHHRLAHTFEDRKALDEAAGSGQFAKTSRTYQTDGRLVSVTRPNGSVVQYEFDGYGTLYRTTTAHSGTTTTVSSPKSFINPFLEVTGQYARAEKPDVPGQYDHLWTLIQRNAAGAITRIVEPKTAAPTGYTGATGEAKHEFEIDVLDRVVEARAYSGPSGSLLRKRASRFDQLGRQNWQSDHVLGFGTGHHYSVWRYAAAKMTRLESMERSGEGSRSFAYSPTTGLLANVTDVANNLVDLAYHANTTFLASVTRTDKEPGTGTRVSLTGYDVDPFGRVTAVRIGGVLQHTYGYDSHGRIDRYTDAKTKLQKFLRDGVGRVVEHVRLDGAGGYLHNSVVYTDSGQADGRTKSEHHDGVGNLTTQHVDFAGRPFLVQNPGAAPGAANEPTPTSPNKSMCLFAEYDEASRIRALHDGEGGTTKLWRDGPGRVIQRALVKHGGQISLWNTKEMLKRDALGRLVETTIFGSIAAPNGVPDHVLLLAAEQADEDSLGRTHEERYWFAIAPANVLRVTSSWTDGTENRAGLDYTDGLAGGLTAPLSVDYGYDAIGRVATFDWTGHNGAVTRLAGYGWVGGLRRERTVRYGASNHPEGKTTFGYDALARVTQITDDVYTAPGVYTTKSLFKYGYDDVGSLVKEAYAKVGGKFGDRFAYDAYHRLTQGWLGLTQSAMNATNDPAGWVSGQTDSYLTYGLDEAGNRAESLVQTNANPDPVKYALQDGSHPQGPSNRYDLVGPSSGQTQFEYDGRGNLVRDGVFILRYDYLNRLQEVWRIRVEGDTAEERYGLVEPGADEEARQTVQLAVPDLLQRLPREHMDPAFRKRLRARIPGGVVRLGGPRRGQGGMPQLVVPAEADLVAIYAYDAYHRRVMGVIVGVDTQFHTWDGWRQAVQYSYDPVPEPDAAVPMKQFVWGSQFDELLSYRRRNGSTWENYFVLHGGQDTAAKLVNANGDVVETYEYDPYGKVSVYVGSSTTPVPESSFGLPFLWKGLRLDPETGFVYMRHRHYSTELGRFLSNDPVGGWTDPVNSGNSYAYVGNWPLSLGDPLGLQGGNGIHVLMTNFGPFTAGGTSTNASQGFTGDVGAGLTSGGVSNSTATLPVDWTKVQDALKKEIEKAKKDHPDKKIVVICSGQHSKPCFELEDAGDNDRGTTPDDAGNKPGDKGVPDKNDPNGKPSNPRPSGPGDIASGAGIPTDPSAGNYICGATAYTLYGETGAGNVSNGAFIHVPADVKDPKKQADIDKDRKDTAARLAKHLCEEDKKNKPPPPPPKKTP